MSQANILFLVALAIVAIVAFLLLQPKDRWSPKPLLTRNEQEFFKRMLDALPDHHVFPQVAFRAILQPTARSSSKAYSRQSGRIGAKHCDFLVCNEKLEVIAIVELDDRTHVAEKDAARDAMTASAGYRTLRYQSKAKLDPAAIRRDIFAVSEDQRQRLARK
ncbi:MAG: DUF2726 domain-containing protein [Nitrosomonas ureae]